MEILPEDILTSENIMVKLSDYNHLKNFRTADQALGNKDSKTIGNNTKLVRRNPSTIVVKLHGHVVVKYNSSGETLVSSAGYKTKTTKDRINRYTPSGFNVRQRDGVWYASTPDGQVRFRDQMRV